MSRPVSPATVAHAPLLERLPPLGEKLVESDVIFERFLDYVSDLALELYPAQEEALLEILEGKNVILATPTGSGKSLVALALHFKAMAEDRRSIYTSPVKALVNEKFFALCEAFHPDNVGLLTGDATVNRDAPILCCTAEIFANMALRQGAQLDVHYAVLDEFHFYSDRERGVAWQLPLLLLPQTRFLLMSATLGDMTFFEGALTELNGAASVTVRSEDRPVPLGFHDFEVPLHETVARLIERGDAPIYLVNFTQLACHEQAQNLMSVDVIDKEQKRALYAELDGVRFDTPYGKDVKRFLRHGIGIHHGGMLPKYRRLVERLAKTGLLRVISGTDTLGVGVNIPIRSVVLTKLCKFDGSRTRILSVRDFKQICGRAGRKGYDDHGTVVAQAPEHVIENIKLEARASTDPKKLKKLVRKKPPTKGYVHWTRATFDGLVNGKAEALESRFQVSHAMILAMLSREEGGCRAMKQLIRSCHERTALRHRHAKTAIQMFRSLVEADVISLVPHPEHPTRRLAQVNVDFGRAFSLTHTLSLFVVETIKLLDRSLESYPLDVLSLVEAVLENPAVLLHKQLDRIKSEALAQMKADGLEYDERMAELDKLDYPRPNAELIYQAFEEFAGRHPWVGHELIRPKGVARELYVECHDFKTFVNGYHLERSEGMVLRYLTDVYKALVQTVPERDRSDALDELIAYYRGVIRGVDSSLLDEWERLRDPSYVPQPGADEEAPLLRRGVTADTAAFTVLVRNAAFRVVQALARGDHGLAASLVEAPPGEAAWTGERIATALLPYAEDHQAIRTDPKARGTEHIRIDKSDPERWRAEQILVDPDDHDDWSLLFDVDLDRSDEAGAAVLMLRSLGPVSS
jgi:hypothetical protein